MDPVEVSQSWWQYGVLGVGIVVFGIVIRFLFKQYQREVRKNQEKDELVARERTAWAVEKERIRGEYDVRYHEVLKTYAEKLQEEHEESQKREDMLRAAHEDMVEKMADEQRKGADALIEMLQKLQDRMVFSRQRGGY